MHLCQWPQSWPAIPLPLVGFVALQLAGPQPRQERHAGGWVASADQQSRAQARHRDLNPACYLGWDAEKEHAELARLLPCCCALLVVQQHAPPQEHPTVHSGVRFAAPCEWERACADAPTSNWAFPNHSWALSQPLPAVPVLGLQVRPSPRGDPSGAAAAPAVSAAGCWGVGASSWDARCQQSSAFALCPCLSLLTWSGLRPTQPHPLLLAAGPTAAS